MPTRAPSSAPLTPLAFLERSADVWSTRPAVVDGERAWTYAEHQDRIRRGAGALRSEFGIGAGERVATLLPNTAEMLELHYAVPGAGGVLVPLNTRLAAGDYAYILEHAGATAVAADRSAEGPLTQALERLGAAAPPVVWTGEAWEARLAAADPVELVAPEDEAALLSINYTSGTTGRPKGVMTSHRGAYLHSLGVIAEAG